MNPDDFILRNDNIRNNCSPLPSVSGVTRHGAQYSRIEVSRVPVFPLHLIPGSGAEVQKTLGIRKSSKDVNPRPGPGVCFLPKRQWTTIYPPGIGGRRPRGDRPRPRGSQHSARPRPRAAGLHQV